MSFDEFGDQLANRRPPALILGPLKGHSTKKSPGFSRDVNGGGNGRSNLAQSQSWPHRLHCEFAN